MNKPVRTTMVLAFVFGFLVIPISWVINDHWVYWIYPSIFPLVLWAQLAFYSVLLARWSRSRPVALLYPLLLLLVVALLPVSHGVFCILALGIFSWIRSGICFQPSVLRGLVAEIVTVVGGVALFFFLAGASPLSQALGFSLFGLVQALYFFIVPACIGKESHRIAQDPFEHAFQEAEKIVGTH